MPPRKAGLWFDGGFHLERLMFKDEEISEARSQDVDRGKKTARSLKKKDERLQRIMLYAIARNKRELFSKALVKIGQPYGSERHRKSMQIFDDEQKRRQK